MNSEVIFFLAAILIVGALILLFFAITSKNKNSKLNKDKYKLAWEKVEGSLDKTNEASYALAVLNADKLLDLALRQSDVKGETMGQRMKAASGRWSNADGVWLAHKLRNKIAHEHDLKINYNAARGALKHFKQGLIDLGAL